jgi:hypothetical protein
VRDRLGVLLGRAMGGDVAGCAVASMERREGEAYAFNEPLLASRLAAAPFDEGDVVVALQFLSPGRHAGPGGDVATICEQAESTAAAEGRVLRTAMTAPIADDERIIAVLERRVKEARAALDDAAAPRWQNLALKTAP